MACFQILSDLHLETPGAYDLFEVPSQAPYLALLGDIGLVRDDGLFTFIEAQLRRFQIVFFLLGNHEPYHSNWTTVKEKVARFSQTIDQKRTHGGHTELGQFVFLDQRRYDLSPEVTVLGCTFHSRVSKTHEERISFGLNDFYYIDGWTVEEHSATHEADRLWLNSQVLEIARSEPHRRIVIFTHHSPTLATQAVDPTHANSPLTSAFSTDLTGDPCWEDPHVSLWVFGHTHYNCDFADERTGKRMVANQRGYYFSQAKGFDVEMVVRV